MTTSDDEYGFDDLVLDDRTLAVLDATERNFTAHPPITRPRSSPERQPTKRLKTNHGWVPRQEREVSPALRGLTRSRFSLEDTDLPEITISNGFYTGPGRFFVGTPQSQPSASPNALREQPPSGTDSDVVLLPTPTVRHPPGRSIVAPPPNRQPRVVSTPVPGTERSTRSVGSGNPPPLPRASSPAARASPLTRSSSFSDAMRTALRNAISEADGPALQRSSSTASPDTPSPLSAGPRIPLLPNQSHSRPSHHLLRRERSLPPTQRLQVPRQPSPHQPTSTPRLNISSVRDELVESLRSEVEEVPFFFPLILSAFFFPLILSS
jgi:hypothetical protein